jgi:hypothetical protein
LSCNLFLCMQFLRIIPRFAVYPGQRLFDPAFDLSQGNADSVYDSLKDDHDGGESAGVASGFDPAAGNYEFQFGEIWVSFCFALATHVI